MITTTIKRIFRSGFVSFWRNGFVSVSSIMVMIITLSVIISTIFASAILTSTLEEIKDKVDINVYFVRSAPEDDILVLKKALEALPEVKVVEYVSREDALDQFKKKNENDQITLQALEELGENPLGASLNIRAKDPSQYEGIVNFLGLKGTDCKSFESKYPIIDKVNYCQNKKTIDTLTSMINSAHKLGFIITLLLVAVSVFITFNTIRLSIFMSKDEIGVMRLVGASRMYIRGPFVVSGAMYGAIAAIITLILCFPITMYVGGMTEDFFIGLNVFSYYIDNFAQIFVIVMTSGIILGAFSSFLAVRRHLKV